MSENGFVTESTSSQPSTSALNLPPDFDRTSLAELLVSVHNFLDGQGFSHAAATLQQEIDSHRILPPRLNLLGSGYESDNFNNFRRVRENIVSLVDVTRRLRRLASDHIPNTVTDNLPIRLATSSSFSLTRTCAIPQPVTNYRSIPMSKAYVPEGYSVRSIIKGVRYGTRQFHQMPLLNTKSVDFKPHAKINGHMAPIYCIAFDRSGKYVITGADDNLIKVWDARTCLLRFTFRGHSGEVCDLAVSHENTVLASGSNDKTVRIWSLQNGGLLHVLKQHTGNIVSVFFPAFFQDGYRYLVSLAFDCSVVFYRWRSDGDELFEYAAQRFVHKEGGNGKMLSGTCSAGGNFTAFSDSQRNIYVYKLNVNNVECVATLKEVHADRVDTLIWSNNGLRFASGSNDGVCKVWSFKYNNWTHQVLKLPDSDPSANIIAAGKKVPYKVHTLNWSTDDRFIVSSGTDNLIRLWNPHSGALLHSFKGHEKVVFVIRPHPLNPDIIVTAGYDGLVFFWDCARKQCLKKMVNFVDLAGKNQPIFDFAFSRDCYRCSYVDDLGNVTLAALVENDRVKRVPRQQFFSTDYQPCLMDDNGFSIDHNAQLAPHLMNPPFLVRLDGIPYAEEWQRCVPGRSAMVDSGADESMPGCCPWLVENIMEQCAETKNDIPKSQLAARDDLATYLLETEKVPPTDVKIEPAPSPVKPVRRRAMEPVAVAVEPPVLMLDSDSDDGDYLGSSGSETESSTVGSEREGGQNEQAAGDDEEDDSDYFEGYNNHDTVFRQGRRRRRRVEQAPEEPSREEQAPPPPTRNSSSANAESARPRRERREREQLDPSPAVAPQPRPAVGRHTRANPAPEEEMVEEEPVRRNRRRARPQPVSRRASSSAESGPSSNQENQEPEPDLLPALLPPSRPSTSRRSQSVQFPMWMRQIHVRRFPYVAQIGDRIVYFPQGHIQYLNACKDLNLFTPNRKHYPPSNLSHTEYAIVEELKYVLHPYRMTQLWLAFTDAQHKPTGTRIKLMYHDLDNVPDFMILRQLYDDSIANHFSPGDEIEAIMDEKWWTGVVSERKYDNDAEYSGSEFCSVVVDWDNGEGLETCSPWDLQPKTNNRGDNVAATESEEYQFGAVKPLLEDWPLPEAAQDVGRRPEHHVRHYMSLCHAQFYHLHTCPGVAPFEQAVNLNDFPAYVQEIAYPIDLQTIFERLRNKYYRTLRQVKRDIQLIAVNTNKFNEANSEIARNSIVLVETIFKLFDDPTISAADTYMQLLESDQEMTAWKQDVSLLPPRHAISDSPPRKRARIERTRRTRMRDQINYDEENDSEEESNLDDSLHNLRRSRRQHRRYL